MRAPVLAVGDGALGFWGALREVFPHTAEQRCWFHKIGNVLSALPKSAHPGAKKALAEIWNAEDRDHARRAVDRRAAHARCRRPEMSAHSTQTVSGITPARISAPKTWQPMQSAKTDSSAAAATSGSVWAA